MKTKYFIFGTATLLAISVASCGNNNKNDGADSVDLTDTTLHDSVIVSQSDAQEATTDKVASDEATAESKKYVPTSPYGDCYIGQRIHVPTDTGIWCEITFYPDGMCELKTKDLSLKGTFSGTVNGSKYDISVKLSDGEEYDFVGSKSELIADDGLIKYVVNQEM